MSRFGRKAALSIKYMGEVNESSEEEEDSLSEPEQSEQMSDSQTFKCDVCNKVLQGRLEDHLLMHKTDAAHTCVLCKENFSTAKLLAEHMKWHKTERRHSCKICGKRFKRACNMYDHMIIHARENPLKCSFCNKRFARESQLTRHAREHKTAKKFNCDQCTMSFSSEFYLNQHVTRSHPGKDGDYTCAICDMKFAHASYVARHMKIHTGEKTHPCTFCDKAFFSKDNLAQHVRTHTGERPFKCEVCGKGFTSVSNLSQHMRVHTGEMPYNCQICDKAFSRSNGLQRHMRTHSGLKPFQCHLCDKLFNDKSNLRLHLKRIHPDFDISTLTPSHYRVSDGPKEEIPETDLDNIVNNMVFADEKLSTENRAMEGVMEREGGEDYAEFQCKQEARDSSSESGSQFGFSDLQAARTRGSNHNSNTDMSDASGNEEDSGNEEHSGKSDSGNENTSENTDSGQAENMDLGKEEVGKGDVDLGHENDSGKKESTSSRKSGSRNDDSVSREEHEEDTLDTGKYDISLKECNQSDSSESGSNQSEAPCEANTNQISRPAERLHGDQDSSHDAESESLKSYEPNSRLLVSGELFGSARPMKERQEHACKVCRQSFPQTMELIQHMRIHRRKQLMPSRRETSQERDSPDNMQEYNYTL